MGEGLGYAVDENALDKFSSLSSITQDTRGRLAIRFFNSNMYKIQRLSARRELEIN